MLIVPLKCDPAWGDEQGSVRVWRLRWEDNVGR